MERCEAGLKYRIVRGCGLQHADAPHRAGLLRTRRDTVTTGSAGVIDEVQFRGEVPHVFDTHVFEPTMRLAARAAGLARRVQSGSLRAYLGYLVALLLVLLALLRLGVFS